MTTSALHLRVGKLLIKADELIGGRPILNMEAF